MNVERVTEQVKNVYRIAIDLSAMVTAMAELENPSALVAPTAFFVRELEQRLDLLAEEFGGWAAIGVVAVRPANDAGAVDG